MTKKLRKIQLYSWLLLIIIIPIILVFTVLGIKESAINDGPIESVKTSAMVASVDNETFFIGIKKVNALTTLEVIVKRSIKSPSATLYGTYKNKKQVIGQLNEKGRYSFELPAHFERLLILDNIKTVELLNTDLRWE